MPEEFEDVTVITTTYESSIYIDKCLQSVISQTIKPKEIITLENNSNIDVIKSFIFLCLKKS